MPRRPSIRYWPSRGGYYTQHRRRQRLLAQGPDDAPSGPTHLAAIDAYRALMEEEGEWAERVSAPTVMGVLDAYLVHVGKTRKPGTLEIRRRFIQAFIDDRAVPGAEAMGKREAARITHADVYAFLERMARPRKHRRRKEQPGRKATSWGAGTQRNCLQALTAGFSWAARSGLLAKNPLAGIESIPASSRGEEALLGRTAEEAEAVHRKILAALPAWYGPFVQALRDTGARPGELMAAEARDFDAAAGAIVFRSEARLRAGRFSHKTASKGKERMILLCGETLANVRRLAAEHPSGPLFRRRDGGRFRHFHIVGRIIEARKRLGMPHLTAYSYRHQFATSMLQAGMDIDTLAGLMGNSPQVLRTHYAHLLADSRGMREKLERFRTAGAGTPVFPQVAAPASPASAPAVPSPSPASPPGRGRRRAAPGSP